MPRKPVLKFVGLVLFAVVATTIFQEGELVASRSASRPVAFSGVLDSAALTQAPTVQLARGYGWKRARKKAVV